MGVNPALVLAPELRVTTPGDVYELVVTCQETATSTYIINVFHFRAVTAGCTATSLIVDWRTNVETAQRAIMSSGANIVRYECFNLIPYSTDWAEQRVTLAGTGGSTPTAALVAWITTWRTTLPGRRYRGRTYWGPISTSFMLGGKINGATTSGPFWALPNAILTRYGATGTSPDTRIGVWSRVNGNQHPPHSPAGFTQIVSFTVQPNLGSMGTRRLGRGM